MEMGAGGRVRVRGHRDPGEGFRVESSFTISVLGAVSGSGSRIPGEPQAGSRRSSLVFRGPAGSEVSEGARGPEVTEQREPRIRCRSGQGLREGTGTAAPAGPFGTSQGGLGGSGTLRTPTWARGVGRFGKAGDDRALRPG